jgi:hypothetical protein
MAIPAKTLDEVLMELDLIIDNSVVDNNFPGIFAFVYRRTTAQIKQAILNKQFEDNERMERMDVTFANLYLTAYQNYMDHKSCSSSWLIAFNSKSDRITIMQHIMLGMNAHINMDLGIAAAKVAPGNELAALKNDFMKVNDVLKSLVNEMQDRVSKVSRLMFLLDWNGQNSDEAIINFSMAKAREQAWNLAYLLSKLTEEEKIQVIESADQTISAFSELIKNPPGRLLKLTTKLIAFFEEKDVKTIITQLRENE